MHLISLLLHQSLATYGLAFLAISAFGVLSIAARILLDPLRKIPGPTWARVSRIWLLNKAMKGNMQETQIDLHERYGPIVRLAPNQYSLNDLEAVKSLYAHGAKFPKSDFYYAFGSIQPGHGSLFSERNEKRHADKRRKVATLYSLTSLLSYEDFVQQHTEVLISKLSQMAQEGKAFSVAEWMQYYAFDVIGAITVGKPFGFLEHGYDFQGILYEIHRTFNYAIKIGTLYSGLHTLITKYGRYVGYSLPRRSTQRYVRDNIRRKREEVNNGKTTEEHTGRQDFLEKMFVLKEKGKLDELDIEINVGSNINAGSDTTAVSLSSIIYHLIRYPNVLQKLRDEIQQGKAAGQISTPIQFKEAQELPYLQAVIKEAMRVHPAAGVSLERIVPPEGATLGDHFFPGGTVVGANPWVLHHNTDVFGPDAAVFRPERWLESKERSVAMEKFNFSFGAGARTCVGKNISLLEMNKVIPELVTRFDFELETPGKEWKLHNCFLVLQEFRCFVRERQAC